MTGPPPDAWRDEIRRQTGDCTLSCPWPLGEHDRSCAARRSEHACEPRVPVILPYEPDAIEQHTDDILSGERRFVIWDRRLWQRYYREGGYDGYRTWLPPHRQLPCDTMEKAVRRPDMADEIRRLSRS